MQIVSSYVIFLRKLFLCKKGRGGKISATEMCNPSDPHLVLSVAWGTVSQ